MNKVIDDSNKEQRQAEYHKKREKIWNEVLKQRELLAQKKKKSELAETIKK